MESLKVNVDGLSGEEKQNVVWLLNSLGFVTGYKSIDFYSYLYACFDTKEKYAGTIQFGDNANTFSKCTFKEVSISELRDLVYANKNSENEKEMNILDEGRFVMEKEEKHSHYKKDVSGLDSVDVYRVLKLFEVTDPCLQHAVKKLLCSGQRGVKSVDKDVQEAIDSLLRYQEMKKEDLK